MSAVTATSPGSARSAMAIRRIGAAVHPHGRGDAAGLQLYPLIGDKDRLQLQSVGGSRHDLLHVARGCVRVNPQLHEGTAGGRRAGSRSDPRA
jgi:hypothetical protein